MKKKQFIIEDLEKRDYPFAELKEKMNSKQFKKFQKWMDGQTVGSNDEGQLCAYWQDIERFLRGQDCID
jgi:hypothetical protein